MPTTVTSEDFRVYEFFELKAEAGPGSIEGGATW